MFNKSMISAAVAVVLAGTSISPAAAQCPTPAEASANVALLRDMINLERRKSGLRPVSLSQRATKAAQTYACEIAARRDIGHIGADGSNVGDRLHRVGLTLRTVTENTAYGFTSPSKTMAAWMASPGHRENILTPEVTQMGAGQADGPYPTWVLDLYLP